MRRSFTSTDVQSHPRMVAWLNDIQSIDVKAGVPSDGDYTVPPPDGTLVLDTSGPALYVRSGGSWVSAALS